ncbi:diguanylate cyclase (GGDEF)-like protein [Pelomonas aquatica]|uniref:Diguanylate cyclase (GGDEF)-like protein n=1 Tax=Pelomonas aquatica TaxID=431058 RepID=A0ABU1Z9E2_9BURK|nr:diguanylate cyclase [Pelomonas aquatica]MDR7296671.1 diguanylate cyclase (GGDEF)-like protein [Pelomonas aquatica]
MRHFNWLIDKLACLAALLGLAGGSALALDAPMPMPWAARSDAVFHRVLMTPMSIVSLAQDREGFIWIATQYGLSRWDGYKLRTYVGDIAVSGALPDSYVLALHVDGKGRLWVGTSAGGLVSYDPQTDRFDPVLAAGAALSRKSVHAVLDEGPDRLWVGTGAGLDLLDTRSGTVQRHAGLARNQGLPDSAVQSLLHDAAGGLWVGTDKGLFHRAAGSARFLNVTLPADEGAPFVAVLRLDSEQRVWVGTRSHGAFVVEAGATAAVPLNQLVKAAAADRGATGVANAAILNMVEAAPGDMWLGTDGGGVLRVDPRSWQLRREQHRQGSTASLPDDDISAMYRDRSGLVWVATDTGLSHYDARQSTVSTWFGGQGAAAGINHVNVPFVLAMPDGRVWLSVGDGGVDIVRAEQGRVAALRPDAAKPLTALPPGRVLSMVQAPDGAVYLGTQRGLYRADADGRAVRRLEVPGRSPTASVWALAMQDGRLWLGGLDGLWAVVPGDGPHLRVLAREDGARLDEQRISALLPGKDGVLWVGTRTGVLRLDTATMALSRPAQDAPGRIGLPTGYISSMLLDRRGRLWVAGFGAGVRVMETTAAPGAEPQIGRVTVAEGLPHNGVDVLVLAPDGDVWASTDAGLAHISQDSLRARSLGAAEGVGILGYWTSAGAAAADGMLLFGGLGGLTIVNPRQAVRRTEPAPLVVTEVRLGDVRTVVPPRPQGANPAVLTLEPQRRSLLVEFSVLDYGAPERNRYEYRLLGVDANWVATEPSRRIATYTNLPPGDHVLELRGTGAQGAWSEVLRLPLHVRARWHETLWFRIGLGLAVCALLAALVQARLLILRRRQRGLEQLVAERTMALEQRTRELQESQQQLEQLAYYDGLTGLANRRLFNDDLRHLMAQAQRNGLGLYLLLIDLDHFKQINDTWGHDAGDAVLRSVSASLNVAVREADRTARLGGDEFAVLLPDTSDPAAAEAVCRRIVDALADALRQARPLALLPSASIGGACYPRDAQDVDALYKAADLALYEAKHAGRARWRLFDGPPA